MRPSPRARPPVRSRSGGRNKRRRSPYRRPRTGTTSTTYTVVRVDLRGLRRSRACRAPGVSAAKGHRWFGSFASGGRRTTRRSVGNAVTSPDSTGMASESNRHHHRQRCDGLVRQLPALFALAVGNHRDGEGDGPGSARDLDHHTVAVIPRGLVGREPVGPARVQLRHAGSGFRHANDELYLASVGNAVTSLTVTPDGQPSRHHHRRTSDGLVRCCLERIRPGGRNDHTITAVKGPPRTARPRPPTPSPWTSRRLASVASPSRP